MKQEPHYFRLKLECRCEGCRLFKQTPAVEHIPAIIEVDETEDGPVARIVASLPDWWYLDRDGIRYRHCIDGASRARGKK